jgi:hypothetical protein
VNCRRCAIAGRCHDCMAACVSSPSTWRFSSMATPELPVSNVDESFGRVPNLHLLRVSFQGSILALLRLALSYCTAMCHSSHLQLLASPSLVDPACGCMHECRDPNFILTPQAVSQANWGHLRRRAPQVWEIVSQSVTKHLSQSIFLFLPELAPLSSSACTPRILTFTAKERCKSWLDS